MTKKRRGQHEGSAYQDPDGSWRGALSAGNDANGKRIRIRLRGATKQEVLGKIAALRGVPRDAPSRAKTTVAELAESWLADAKSRVRANTHATYSTAIRKHALPHLGAVIVRDLSPVHLRKWLTTLERTGVLSRARQSAFEVLGRMLDHAVTAGLTKVNVVRLVPTPPHEAAELAVWTADHAARFLAANIGHPLRVMILLLLGTGLRRGEVMGLRWADLDLDRGILVVRRQHVRTYKGQGDGPPKTARSQRAIDLPAIVVADLRTLRAQSPEREMVFGDIDDAPLSIATLHRRWSAMLDAAPDVPRIRFHDLRHSSATLLLAAGTNARVVADRLGHSDVATTLRVYAHVMPTMQAGAAAALDEALTRGPTGGHGVAGDVAPTFSDAGQEGPKPTTPGRPGPRRSL